MSDYTYTLLYGIEIDQAKFEQTFKLPIKSKAYSCPHIQNNRKIDTLVKFCPECGVPVKTWEFKETNGTPGITSGNSKNIIKIKDFDVCRQTYGYHYSDYDGNYYVSCVKMSQYIDDPPQIGSLSVNFDELTAKGDQLIEMLNSEYDFDFTRKDLKFHVIVSAHFCP